MLKDDALVAKIGVHTAENEPSKVKTVDFSAWSFAQIQS